MSEADIYEFQPRIPVSRESINSLTWKNVNGNHCIRTDYNDGKFSAPLLASFGEPTVQLGEGKGKTPEEAITRTLITANRAQHEGCQPWEVPEAEKGMVPAPLRRESRFGLIAIRSEIMIYAMSYREICVQTDIFSPEGDRKPVKAMATGVDMIDAVQNFTEEFDFDIPPYDQDRKRHLLLPITAFDDL